MEEHPIYNDIATTPTHHAVSDRCTKDESAESCPGEPSNTININCDRKEEPQYAQVDTRMKKISHQDSVVSVQSFSRRPGLPESATFSADLESCRENSSSDLTYKIGRAVTNPMEAALVPLLRVGVLDPTSYSSSFPVNKQDKNNLTDRKRKAEHVSHDSLQKAITALYANILVILGVALPLSEVISENIHDGYYQMFYVYLYLGSLLFLLFIYIDRIQAKTRSAVQSKLKRTVSGIKEFSDDSGNSSKTGSGATRGSPVVVGGGGAPGAADDLKETPQSSYGSFYLRLGTVLFGIGSLIYTGIEIGGIFEVGMLSEIERCGDIISIVRPALQIVFIFTQMYFIFLNQKMNVYKHKMAGRLGLMHMIATNLCVWLKVLIMETKHEIELAHVRRTREIFNTSVNVSLYGDHEDSSSSSEEEEEEGLLTPPPSPPSHHWDEGGDSYHHHGAGHTLKPGCNNKIMYKLLEDSSPFLFPCTIEFSLICAAVLFIMWKNVATEHELYKHIKVRQYLREKSEVETFASNRRHQQYSVDCSHANTGLFCGIVVVVITIISLIIFFVFISNEETHMKQIAVQVASVSELTLYGLTTIAVLLGLGQMRGLWYDVTRKLELDNLLLVIAQTGVFIYAAFSIIGTFFQLEAHLIAFLASLATLIQTTLQTVFILDASCRFAYTSQQVRQKPGREVVTFLLVCNLAMWLMNTLETNRADSHPIQVEFYGGDWAWPMITHISMPLAIFYRFHSTVCLFEIWKKSFKYKPSNINFI